ncbi:CYTH domain-containing protein [Latilactobacillus fuchuensis]|uniref:CYTH domain-containing protein n=1 Tax=Latilactobacillus fuchuensis DSM 14340 = JCM 11249 TaxID=1423747 RepID=A0A0R1RXT3_9LACO|nr:CYTH domain-containing protein [Latilactobacillus fuchuensis]KRL61789.1 hypothetical protein FC69_GL002014 [Latilactobacillus fuchuensis DSM 14340 = JCM 11249]
MTQTTEREFKTLITKAQFNQIKNEHPTALTVHQTNYYFELPDQQLRQQGLALRIRQFAADAEQTLKVPTNSAQRTLIEITEPLSLDVAEQLVQQQTIQPDGPIMTYFNEQALNWPALTIWGYSTTERTIFNAPQGQLMLDQTSFPDQFVDYELELEVTDFQTARPYFEQLVQHYSIKLTPVINKIQRASQHQAH